jgi:hypothetical protein
MAKREIFSIKALKEKKYHELDLAPEYSRLMGRPERKFTSLFYGESGSGKSVYALQFADYFAKNFGKVIYNSHEEGANKTIQDRLFNYSIDASKLFVSNALSFDKMCRYIEKNYYKLVVIDSVKYMHFTFNQLIELRERFAKRQLSIVMIDFGAFKGKPDSGRDLLHASDVKLYFKNGRAYAISRYLDKPAEQQLFIQQSPGSMPSLFNY